MKSVDAHLEDSLAGVPLSDLAPNAPDSHTVVRGDTRRRIEFTMPAARELPRHQVTNYVLACIISLFGLVLGVALGWRRADLTAFRGLAGGNHLLDLQDLDSHQPAGLE